MVYWSVVALVWLLCSLGSGAAIAWLYKRLHPKLAFYKLWALWTMIISAFVALLFGFGAL